MMKMAYIAINKKTKKCYAICSANPNFAVDTLKEIKLWKKEDALVELLPKHIAKERFLNDL